jgi:hypothetical protein
VFQKLVSHNDDLRRLVEKGYAVAFDTNHLVVRDLPYLDNSGAVQIGAIVTKLEFVDKERVTQTDHQVFFAGTVPHGLDGTPIPNLAGGPTQILLGPGSHDVVVQRSFSNKPKRTGKFLDFFEKIESYVTIICGPAIERYGVTPYTFRAVPDVMVPSVFKLHDTLTTRAEISDLAALFQDDILAIIGLGGTGSYLLDLLVKTPAREIRSFDLDTFRVHNAFRSPGRLELKELGRLKADVYRDRYDGFRTGLKIENKCIDLSSGNELDGVTFAFVAIDKGSARSEVFDLLISKRIPFIDVGMGLQRKGGRLNGMMRTTYYPAENGQAVKDKNWAQLADTEGDLYRTNIQISELNALNACLAVIRYKQLRGFYCEELPTYHLLFEIADLKIVGETDLS